MVGSTAGAWTSRETVPRSGSSTEGAERTLNHRHELRGSSGPPRHIRRRDQIRLFSNIAEELFYREESLGIGRQTGDDYRYPK
jgi:hypothetical protein